MFSKIGTMELLVILVIALFVIGPEKLPGVAKSVGKMLGAARHYLKDIVGDVETEVKAVEEGLKGLESDLKDTRDILKSPLKEPKKDAEAAPAEKAEAPAEASPESDEGDATVDTHSDESEKDSKATA